MFALSAATWNGVVGTLKPSTDSPAVATTYGTAEESKSEDLKSVTFAALPTACSRHNSPALPFAIARAMDKVSTSGEMLIVHVMEDQSSDLATARCVATARQFPMYNHKSGASKGGDVTVCTVDKAGSALDITDSGVAHVMDSMRIAAGLVDMPCAELNTTSYTKIAQDIAKEIGVEDPLVISGTDLRDQGFGGLWGVGKALSMTQVD
ncbi:NPEPL1 [Symbiodinium sp. KB8]|nr:NPEPL1 [Symbiodinium sp. KB8]